LATGPNTAETIREDSEAGFDVLAALEAGEIGAWEWNLASGEMRWSAQMARNLGLDPNLAGDLYGHLLNAIHPTERTAVSAAFAEFRERPGPMRIEARLVWPDDEPHWVVFLGQTAADASGKPSRMHGITIDSTRQTARAGGRRRTRARRPCPKASAACGSSATACSSGPNDAIASSAPAAPKSRRFSTTHRIG
jgi:hypothetical protein